MDDVVNKQSAGGIIYHDGKFLALYIRGHEEVVFPKGTIEPGETPEQAATREVFEETGYRASITQSLGNTSYEFAENDIRYHKIVHYYLMRLIDPDAQPTPQPEDYEDFDILWLTAEEAMVRLTHEQSRSLLQKAVDRLL